MGRTLKLRVWVAMLECAAVCTSAGPRPNLPQWGFRNPCDGCGRYAGNKEACGAELPLDSWLRGAGRPLARLRQTASIPRKRAQRAEA